VIQSLRRARSRLDDSTVPQSRWTNSSVQVWMSHKPPIAYPSFPYKGSVNVAKRPDYVIGRCAPSLCVDLTILYSDSRANEPLLRPTGR
jgi:hypothetical protein